MIAFDRRKFLRAAGATAVGAGLAGCADEGTEDPGEEVPGEEVPGEEVSGEEDGEFESDTADEKGHTFEQNDRFRYECTNHGSAGMKGAVVVAGADE